MITPEQIYQKWFEELNKTRGVKFSRKIKNFEKIKSSERWKYFEACSNLVNRNINQLDYNLYIEALFDFYKTYFNPQFLVSRKSLAIYRSYIDLKETTESPEQIKQSILSSIRFVTTFCKENEIKNFGQYLNYGAFTIPVILQHYISGSISLYFLAAIPDFILIANGSYPKDVITDYLKKDFVDKYHTFRARIVFHKQNLGPLFNNIEEIINKILMS